MVIEYHSGGVVDMKNVMNRAWTIFRETYNYPRMPFRFIGRPCFAWALRKAWAEYPAGEGPSCCQRHPPKFLS